MSAKDTDALNIPAFPSGPASGNWGVAFVGMSLRDYFAAKVMHSELLSSGSFEGPAAALAESAANAGQTIEERIAVLSYRMADAMLKERAK